MHDNNIDRFNLNTVAFLFSVFLIFQSQYLRQLWNVGYWKDKAGNLWGNFLVSAFVIAAWIWATEVWEVGTTERLQDCICTFDTRMSVATHGRFQFFMIKLSLSWLVGYIYVTSLDACQNHPQFRYSKYHNVKPSSLCYFQFTFVFVYLHHVMIQSYYIGLCS